LARPSRGASPRPGGWLRTDLDAAARGARFGRVIARVPGDIREATVCRTIIARVVSVTGRIATRS
jgi:hypothetical protein